MGINLALRYPQRKRCGRCRSYFAWVVIDGLWCSRRCARLEEISSNPEDWPREHFSYAPHSNSQRRPKKDFLSRAEAVRAAKRCGKTEYQCNYCLGWHIGSLNPNGAKPDPRLVLPL